MSLAKVLARGQVTLPRDVRNRAGIKPGDAVHVEVLGPGRVEVTVLPRFSPRELHARYPITVAIDEVADRAGWQARAAADLLGAGVGGGRICRHERFCACANV